MRLPLEVQMNGSRLNWDRTSISRLIYELEKVGCDVLLDGETHWDKSLRFEIAVPSLDAWIWPFESVLSVQRFFFDRMHIELVQGGVLRCRVKYWQGPQILLHGIITLIFLITSRFEYSEGSLLVQLIFGLLLSHGIAAIITWIQFRLTRRQLLRRLGYL